jgi:hypothetical protein
MTWPLDVKESRAKVEVGKSDGKVEFEQERIVCC